MNRLIKPLLVIACAAIAVMWVYAFGFSSKDSINKIGDSAWQDAAEKFCAQGEFERLKLADLRLVKESGSGALAERATLVDKATKTLELALDQIEKLPIADEKGKAIIPLWIADYRTYIEDRRDYADILRSGKNVPFSETQIEGLPLSEKISTFAADNYMSSCKAPVDLSV
jgi:hypothetical protein